VKKIISIFLGLCLVFMLAGCRSLSTEESAIDNTSEFLQQSQILHQAFVSQQINKDYKLWRCDHREPWYAEFGEALYLYTIPYVPYFLYNNILVYGEETLHLLADPVVGGTRWQDEKNKKLQEYLIDYDTCFYKVWDSPRKYADFVNMDEYEYSPSYLVR